MTAPERPPRRKWLPDFSAWGFSRYERRALWFLTALVILGSGYRYWQHQRLAKTLALWVTPADSAAAAALADFGSPAPVIQPVNLNSATAAQLEALPGIGPKRAADIISYRDKHGALRSLDELDNVPGIGPKTLERLRPYLLLDDSVSVTAASEKVKQ